MQKARDPNCCEIIGLILYTLFRVFIIVCPVIAQIRVIYILCKPEDYLENPDKCTRVSSHLELMIGLYIVVYLVFYSVYHLLNFVLHNWNNTAQPWKMHTAQFIGGLIVFKIYYELFKLGKRGVYGPQATYPDAFFGTVLLTILTIGLFLIYRYLQFACQHWSSQDKCTRQTIRFTAGLGIFYIYYHLWRIGIQYVYDHTTTCPKQTLGTLILTIVTVGIFIPFRIINLICKHWYNQNPYIRETARFFGGLGILYLYCKLWEYGIKYTYGEEVNCGKQFAGNIFLSLATFTLFIPFRILQLICQNWNSQIIWKRQLARCIGLLVVFYLWYKVASAGYRSVYRSDQQQAVHREEFNENFGHLLLVLATFGGYILYKPFELIYRHWYDENTCKRETARFFGGLGIFYIYYQLLHYGIKWVYKDNEDNSKFVMGNIFLVLASFGIYIPYRIIELIITKWNDDAHPCQRQTARILGSLIIGYVWYHMAMKGVKWVCSDQHCEWYETLLGYVFLTIVTLGVFLPIQLYRKGVQHTYHSQDNYCLQIIGHIQLTIITLTLFLPFRLIQVIYNNWNSQNPYKKHTVRAIAGLMVFYLWYQLIMWASHQTYNQQQSIIYKIIGRLVLIIATIGLYIPVMVVEYFIHMCVCLNNHYFLSREYILGVAMASAITGGLFGIITMTKMQNRLFRYTANLILIIQNVAAVYFLYTKIILPITTVQKYKPIILVVLCIISYPFIKFMVQFVIYNYIIRMAIRGLQTGLLYIGRAIRFGLAKLIYPLYLLWIIILNWFSRMNAWLKTFGSTIYAIRANRRWVWDTYFFRMERIEPDNPEYYVPVVYLPTIYQAEPFIGWDERQQIRINRPRYVLDLKRRNHQYIIDCVAANIKYNFNNILGKHSNAAIDLWHTRYTQLRDTLASKALYERIADVSLDDPNNWRRVETTLENFQRRRKEIVSQPIEYFNGIESDGAFEISAN